MDMITSINTRTQALKDVLNDCNAALADRGAGAAPNLSGLAARIRGISNLRVIRGSITPEANTSLLTLPIPGFPKAVSLCQKEISLTEYSIPCVSYDPFNWKTIAGDYKCIMFYVSDGIVRVSALEPTFDGSQMSLSALPFLSWLGGKEHIWEAYYWDDLSETLKNTPMGEPVVVDGVTHYGSDLSTAVASYDVGESAKLYLIPTAAGHLRAAIVGSGATRDYSYKETHEWDNYGAEIKEIFVAEGITHLGNAVLARLSKATRFVGASTVLTSVGELAFYRCFALRSLIGLDRVTSIGNRAFLCCPAITSIDLDEAVCKSIGECASHISGMEDAVNLEDWRNVDFGLCANRRLKWGEALEEVQNTKYTATKILPCPNPDMQTNYPNIHFVSLAVDGELYPVMVGDGGCAGLSLYHAYNAIHSNDGRGCATFEEFWRDVLEANTYTVPVTQYIKQGLIDPIRVYDPTKASGYVDGVEERNGHIYFHLYNFGGGTDEHEIMGAMIRKLGWKMSNKIPTYGAEAKRLIDRSLQQGIPVLASVNHLGLNEQWEYNEGDHEVCIIGCDAVTDKLTVVDSTGAAGERGHIYTVSYEDMFYCHEEQNGRLRNSIIILDIGEGA